MRELFFECPPLLLALFKIKAKTFILSLKLRYLLFERRILLIRQRNALAKYRSRAMLVDEFFESVEQSHVDTPNVLAQGRPEAAGRRAPRSAASRASLERRVSPHLRGGVHRHPLSA